MSTKTHTTDDNELIDDIEGFIRSAIEGMEWEPKRSPRRGRPRILPALCLWAGLLICVLRGMSNQTRIWRLLTKTGLWDYPRFPVSDEAVYKRLRQADSEPLQRLFRQISAAMARRIAKYENRQLAPFANGVYALDVTTLDKAARTLPPLPPVRNTPQQLAGRLAAVFNVRLQQWHHVQYVASAVENEKRTAEALLATVPAGAMVLADMGYFSFRWFDTLTDNGYWWLSRIRQRTSFKVLHTYYQHGDTFDGIVWLGAHRADRAAHAVRLLTFPYGTGVHRYITNVRNPSQLSMRDAANLYARRWDVELAFKFIKRDLNLHLLWSSHQNVILHQIWAVLTISQVLMGLRMEIAGRAGVDPFDVSLSLMVEYIPSWSRDGTDMLTIFVEEGRSAGFIRPSRRIRMKVPPIRPSEIDPLPPDLLLTRKPRYAGRRC